MIYINLNRDDTEPLTKQLYHFIKEAVLNGTLKQDEKLPSTREFSKFLNISRNVIIDSYEQLIAEGYLYTKNGAGTYVNAGIVLERKKDYSSVQRKTEKEEAEIEGMISFRTGIPDLSLIPIKKWGQIYKKITLSASSKYMDYQKPCGQYELRYELANYLRCVRGVRTRPENIIITNGAAQSFSLICQTVSDKEYAIVENPLSYGLLNTLDKKCVRVWKVPMDQEGMITSRLPDIMVKLIFTTPSHQFPTGVVLPIKRRIEMIKYARKHNAFIVEDDYDSEFRFEGSPIESMQSLDPEHVVYVGTFSKTFMPSLRMGYMILPDCLCEQMVQAKYIDDLHCPAFEQLTMAEFIKEGLLSLHIKKMKNVYFKKRNTLIECLKNIFGDKVYISGAQAGMHLIAYFKDINFDDALMQKIKDKNIEITAVRKHYIASDSSDHNYDNALIFGYGNTNKQLISKGIQMLYEVLY